MGGRTNKFLKQWRFFCLSLCVIALSLGLSGPVFAQADEDEEEVFTLEEIIVTAEKREAELQKIPMEISVLRKDDMEKANVFQIYDLEKLLPDVSTQSLVSSYVIVSIRDVTTGQFNAMYEHNVATHIDGVQLTSFSGLENQMFDLERVEVLKGPQGTLYGRGATAGSMNLISRKPVMNEFSGNAGVEFGNFALYSYDLALNIPLITDKLAMRVAGRKRERDGYSDSGYEDSNSMNARLSLKWEPTERTTFTFSSDLAVTKDTGRASVLNAGDLYYSTYGDVTIVENTVEPIPPYTNGGTIDTPWQSKWAIGDRLLNAWVDTDQYGVQGVLEHEFDIGYLTAQFGHRSMFENKNYQWNRAGLSPYPYTRFMGSMTSSPLPVGWRDPDLIVTEVALYVNDVWLFIYDGFTSDDSESYEVRLTSKSSIPAGDELEWIIGGMRQNDKISMNNQNFSNRVTTVSEALFGQATWQPLEHWSLTAGGRLSWDKKYYNGIRFTHADDGSYIIDMSTMRYTQYSWKEPTYKLTLSYLPTDDVMTYIQHSKGYRTGNVGMSEVANDPEILKSWEYGIKSRWLDNKLQFNTTVYYYDYKNYSSWAGVTRCRGAIINAPDNAECEDVWTAPTDEERAADPFAEGHEGSDGISDDADEMSAGIVGLSAGGAEQSGVSVDIIWMLTMNDTVSMRGSWHHNIYKKYNIRQAILDVYDDAITAYRVSSGDQTGLQFGGAPIRLNMSYDRRWYIGSDVLTTTGTLYYNGKGLDAYMNYGSDLFYMMPGRDAYWTGDVSANYSSSRWVPEGMMWNVRFYCNNVWDSDALSRISYSDDYTYGLTNCYPWRSGTISGGHTLPRTYSLTIGLSF